MVHLTDDPWSGRRIAIKQASPVAHAQARLVDEHNILSSLDLPVVPSCGRIGVLDDGGVYLTMEHVWGQGVMASVRRAGAPGAASREAAARQVLRRLLRALVMLHGAGVLHGDLKTRNMRLSASGAIRLLDFGAARRLDPVTQEADGAHFMGTPRYAPPEQRQRQRLDVRSDLFSAGALTVRLLIDDKPEWPPKPPAGLADRELATLLSALLSLDPSDRPDSAAAALSGLPGPPPPVASWWPGSAAVYVDRDPVRRRRRREQLDAVSGVGVRISTDGAALETALRPLLPCRTPATLWVSELHTASEAAQASLARLLRRAWRLDQPLHLRATAAPDPALRGALPLAAFVPIPAPSHRPDAWASGRWEEALACARGADPALPAERPRICAAIECWRSLGQLGEATRLARSLQPLRSGAERTLAASVAEARGELDAAARLADDDSERAAAIRWLAGETERGLPAGRWGSWCLRLRGAIVDITDWPAGWRLEASARRGESARAMAWLAEHGLADHPEARGGLRAQIARNILKNERAIGPDRTRSEHATR